MTDQAAVPVRHPAKFSTPILAKIDALLDRYGRGGVTLDPFAGVGRVHTLRLEYSVGIELEPEWATQHPRTITGNALHLPFRAQSIRRLVTSPTYSNRMADAHDAQERCKPCRGDGELPAEFGTTRRVCSACSGEGRRWYQRNTYTHTLGRKLHPDNSGAMQWGPKYRDMHVAAWTEAWRVLEGGALFVLNASDHIRAGKVVPVSAWHRDTLTTLGFAWEDTMRVTTQRNGMGANGKARVGHEDIHVLRKVA